QAALQDLEVNLANARRDLQRAESLQRSGVTSAQSLDVARTAVDSLQARIALTNEQVRAAEARAKVAEQDLDNTVIRSPLPDMGVKVSFLGDQPAKGANANAVLVPREAMREDGKAVLLYRDGMVERRAVRAGEVRGADQEIVAGVAVGDQVLVRAPQEINDG